MKASVQRNIVVGRSDTYCRVCSFWKWGHSP